MSFSREKNGISTLRRLHRIAYRTLAVSYPDRRGLFKVGAYLGDYRVGILKIGIIARYYAQVGNAVRRLGKLASAQLRSAADRAEQH